MKFKVITVCYNTAMFIEHLYLSVKKTIEFPFDFIVIDNGSDKDNLSIIANMNKKYKIETWMREQDDIWAPSRHHGEAIDYAISKMEDDDYVIHIDCDCIMLMRNWGSLIAHLLKEYDHVSCVRPLIKHLDTGPWFTAFQVKNIRNHNITFMPKIDDEGKDLKCESRYDVGSDLIRMGDNWKKIESIKNSKKYGNIWAIDEAILMAHMGKASHGRGGNFMRWRKYIHNKMGVKYGKYKNEQKNI